MKFRRQPITEMMIIDQTVKIVDANVKVKNKLKKIINGEASVIGDLVWSNKPNETVVTIMFLSHDRKRVDNIYLVPYPHFLRLLTAIEQQSI